MRGSTVFALLPLAWLAMISTAAADPCGMVPPIYPGNEIPLARKGLQQTYVFYQGDVETFVIRPGFQGKVDEFGMLIPFPTPPAIRKAPDHIFSHIDAAVDPPEVVVNLFPPPPMAAVPTSGPVRTASAAPRRALRFDEVRVVNQEAVGMYEVAVLQAGSPAALKRWMDDHRYRFPQGMEAACKDYIADQWCFVAVKTQVGKKKAADPSAGLRNVNTKLPPGSVFNGAVQAMGFRFRTKELVVPMRLSTFNKGDLRNVVYILSEGPRKIRNIPEEYVVRQLTGKQLMANVTQPLPLRILGGTHLDIPDYRRRQLAVQRDPTPKNGAAKELFTSDLLAASKADLTLSHETAEKELLKIGERLKLRGAEIDKANAAALASQRKQTVDAALNQLEKMTLTVVDGDFPRDVLSKQNLTFATYNMPATRNKTLSYNATIHRRPSPKGGVLFNGPLPAVQIKPPKKTPRRGLVPVPPAQGSNHTLPAGVFASLIAVFAVICVALSRRWRATSLGIAIVGIATLQTTTVLADPCGMVPPITTGGDIPVVRTGLQQTYVFYKDGVETIVLRPGFKGKVDEFGMLIPFPAPPAIRKTADNVFPQIDAAIDPPEVVVDLELRRRYRFAKSAVQSKSEPSAPARGLAYHAVKVLKQEAVGMYEVAVLEAGSPEALKRWMKQHGYRYPTGMDTACAEYVESGWCFVAVKAKVGQKKGVEPQAGQRTVNAKLPAGASFTGHVQGMGFRFRTKELIVPMRLSTFNKGDLRNVVYLLTDGPRRIRAIPEEYVVRQLTGEELVSNLTQPLPLRIIGGTVADIPAYRRQLLPEQRRPEPKNGVAKELFASDLLAIQKQELSLTHEEQEKALLAIGEHLKLRGAGIDRLHGDAFKVQREKTVKASLESLKKMTLTVVDGDFPRDVLRSQNLTFAEYTMPKNRNAETSYNALLHTTTPQKKRGVLHKGELPAKPATKPATNQNGAAAPSLLQPVAWAIASLMMLAGGVLAVRRFGRTAAAAVLLATALCTTAATPALAQKDAPQEQPIRKVLNDLSDSKKASAAVEQLVARADESKELLMGEALEGNDLPRRGWAIIALSEIGGADIDAHLAKIHADEKQKPLVRTWAAAARVAMCDTADQLIEKAALVPKFPALGRPVGMRLVEKLNENGEEISPEGILSVSIKVPNLQKALAPAILALGPDKLVTVMASAKDQNVRRQAAAYLGTLASQGNKKTPSVVVQQYKFSVARKDVPWQGGPLFVPGLQWTKEDAKALAGNLVQWHLWCDINNRAAEKKQIHNNIRSLSLARAAGYNSPGFREVDTTKWLQIWKAAYGADEVRAMLEAQGVEDNARYTAALK